MWNLQLELFLEMYFAVCGLTDVKYVYVGERDASTQPVI